ncbi:MAG TPA: response regulator [Edaphobacter sp.]
MRRRILLVDDEVAVLLTLKAVLEISGFDVDTATSAREGKLKLRSNEYCMVISDMRMESERAGEEILEAASKAPHRPTVALLTAYPLAEEDWQELGADRLLVKPLHTRLLLGQIDALLAAHDREFADSATGAHKLTVVASGSAAGKSQVAAKSANRTARKLALVTAGTAATGKSGKKPAKGVSARKPGLKLARKKARRT